jgi:potassium/hydrogen antiporter
MDALTDFSPQLLLVAALLLAALAAAPLAGLVGIPGPAPFLAVGIAAGLTGIAPVDGLSGLHLQEIGVIALYAILFQGGLATGFLAWRREARPILILGLPGTAATAALLATFAHYVLGLEWALASFVGIALAPTDPAAVYAVLRRSKAAAPRTILEGESGFNDPIGISFMVVAVDHVAHDDASAAGGLLRLVQELGIGLVGGVVGAALLIGLLAATPRIDQSLQGAAMVVGAFIVGAATASLHGSGFLAVYIAGLLLADRWTAQDGNHHEVPERLSAIAEPVLFALLGASFAPLVGLDDLWQGIAIAIVGALVVRPLVASLCLLGSGLTRGERFLVSWGGLKGAVPLLLAAFPALESLDGADASKAIVLVATAASVVVQGATLSGVARRSLGAEPSAG